MPRKNLRGITQHIQGLVNQRVHDEFPCLSPVWVLPTVLHKEEGLLGHWYEVRDGDKILRYICLNLSGCRHFYLAANDAILVDLVRHELLHGELRRLERPHGDSDPGFILECLRRRIQVNDVSVGDLERAYGRGSFDVFKNFLPAPEYEPVVLAGSAGAWLREKR